MKKGLCFFLVLTVPSLSLLGHIWAQASKAPKQTPELVNQGKKLYEQNCLACHGASGDGKGPAGAALKPPPKDFTQPLGQWPITKGVPQKIFEVISKGIPNSAMVKWDHLPEQDRWALTYYVMTFARKPPPPKKK